MARKQYRGRWRIVRRQALERDGYRCRQCGRAGRLEVDHVRRVSDGGAVHDLANLQTLCRGCHIAKTRSERAARPSKWEGMVQELINEKDL